MTETYSEMQRLAHLPADSIATSNGVAFFIEGLGEKVDKKGPDSMYYDLRILLDDATVITKINRLVPSSDLVRQGRFEVYKSQGDLQIIVNQVELIRLMNEFKCPTSIFIDTLLQVDVRGDERYRTQYDMYQNPQKYIRELYGSDIRIQLHCPDLVMLYDDTEDQYTSFVDKHLAYLEGLEAEGRLRVYTPTTEITNASDALKHHRNNQQTKLDTDKGAKQ